MSFTADWQRIAARLLAVDAVGLNEDPHVDLERRHSAVAVVLRPDRVGSSGLDVLLVKRAQRQGDRWSGHMAFPGGHWEENDDSLMHTAVRETQEEVSVPLLQSGQALGRLPAIGAVGRGQAMNLDVHPFVFGLHEDVSPSPDPAEVEESIWVPLAQLRSPKQHYQFGFETKEGSVDLPAIDAQGRRVWGLTYHMLQALFQRLR